MSRNPELEMELIREFAVGGVRLGSVTSDDWREHIRLSIYKGNLVHRPFRDLGKSYAEVYEQCFGTPLELRRVARVKPKAEPHD